MLLPQTRRFPISIRFLAQPLLDRESVRCPSVWAHRRRVNKQRFRGQRRGTNCKNTRLCGSSASIAVNIGTQTDCGNGRLRRHHHHHLTISHSSSSSGPTSQHPVTVQCSERVLILVCKHLDKGNLVVFLWKSNSGATEIEMWLNIDFLLIYRSNII